MQHCKMLAGHLIFFMMTHTQRIAVKIIHCVADVTPLVMLFSGLLHKLSVVY